MTFQPGRERLPVALHGVGVAVENTGFTASLTALFQ